MTTKSDAIARILPDACSNAMYRDAARLVDALSALGILKLDEPKSVFDEVWEIIRAHTGTTYCQAIMRELDAGGFKIVRK